MAWFLLLQAPLLMLLARRIWDMFAMSMALEARIPTSSRISRGRMLPVLRRTPLLCPVLLAMLGMARSPTRILSKI